MSEGKYDLDYLNLFEYCCYSKVINLKPNNLI